MSPLAPILVVVFSFVTFVDVERRVRPVEEKEGMGL
jgi:hypothetical protein